MCVEFCSLVAAFQSLLAHNEKNESITLDTNARTIEERETIFPPIWGNMYRLAVGVLPFHINRKKMPKYGSDFYYVFNRKQKQI